MSRTLTLIHAGWSSVQALVRQGRRHEARVRVRRLLDRTDLPPFVAADAHRLAAELAIEAEQYATARRHLTAAAELEPSHARTHYLAGLAHENDPHGDDRKAAVKFRTAAELDPKTALYRACFGRAAVRCDKLKTGVRALVAAAEAAPAELPVIRVVVDGLIEAGKAGTARRLAQIARFRNPGSRELTRLWERARFAAAHAEQAQREPQDAAFATEGALTLLPFIRVVRPGAKSAPVAGTIRRDLVSKPRPHLPRLMGKKADR
ncbi:MAG: hypothetical protein K2P78_03290 [Gemmataceae bacterium]|nr:hypothetical protein [Gemmataceae bacterium]